MNESNEKEEKLKYSIYKYSTYSGIYTPEKIFENNPTDQTSRWSSESNNPPQFLILQLESPAILKKITFGKFEKPHVCNLKRFTIFGSLNENGFIELFSGGLKNDSQQETFSLRHMVKGHPFPCQYLKIVPIQSWAVSFNYSIWYVELRGDRETELVSAATLWLKKYKEREALRLCLKHLRQTNFLDVYELLQQRSDVHLEHFLITKLYESLVMEGDFVKSENIIVEAAKEGALDCYVSKQSYIAEWSPIVEKIDVSNEQTTRYSDSSPGMRGGHQMIIDVTTETIFLFGGWDGCQDLSDFWAYDITSRTWTCISKNTAVESGPTPRSCHKMVLDPITRRIFCLGRYVEASSRLEDNLKNDFYVYDIQSNLWQMICDDTYRVSGPKLIFDHQMTIDHDREIIYCFGGRILSATAATDDKKLLEQQFSGLYAYHIPTDSWALIREDCNEISPSPGFIRSRFGHSMLFHQVIDLNDVEHFLVRMKLSRCLYIFAGQRAKDYLTDMFIYHIDRDEIEMIGDAAQKPSQVPAPGFTQRATIDTDLNEIYVFSGLSKDREKKDDCVQNSFWVYSITFDRWSCVYQNDNDNERNEVPSKLQYAVGMARNRQQAQEPCPRYAHQLVYDNIRKIHYLFGGNPGKNSSHKIRLDDFWSLNLHRPTKQEVERKCKFLLRKCKFRELLSENPVTALDYLQKNVSQIVNDDETTEFHRLAAQVFEQFDEKNLDSNRRLELRNELFNELSSFFPEDMTPPKESLLDLIPI